MFSVGLGRIAALGFRLVITAPAESRTFARGLRRFPERRVDPVAPASWDEAYRQFRGGGDLPLDRGSWRILAVDPEGGVAGAITARFFCGEVVRSYVHAYSLLEGSGPVFRDECELAIAETFAGAVRENRTAAEISHWTVADGRHAVLVAATLGRAMEALSAAFDAPVGVVAANHRRREVGRLLRLGGVPLGRAGKFSLPPFPHHPSGAWFRLMLIDAEAFRGRLRAAAIADLARLRTHCPIFSAA